MKQRILRLVILFLLLSPVLAFAASPTVSPSDRLEDPGTLDLHVTWNGMPASGAPVYLYSETGIYLDRFAKTDARGHAQFTVPITPHNFKVEYRGKEYWTGNLFAITDQTLGVEVVLEKLADISTNNPTAARYDGEPPVFNHEPIQVASLGTYIGILSQASVAQVQPQSKVYYFITDHLGTPMKMTNESGAVVWSADYRPFGELSVSNSTVENKFRFPGQYYDSETGLHYNYHRFYQPKTGRYVTPDPIGLAGGTNPFVYVTNNPINSEDPNGLAAFFWHGIITFAAGLTEKRGWGQSSQMAWESMWRDKGTQSLLSFDTNIHGMVGWDPAKGRDQYSHEAIMGALQIVEDEKECGSHGNAMHTLQDLEFFWHAGKKWEGNNPLKNPMAIPHWFLDVVPVTGLWDAFQVSREYLRQQR